MGKNILHVAVWKKGDERTTYHMIYVDSKSGKSLAKRFNVTGVTRDREYDLTKKNKGSKVHYFSANPNGEGEVVNIQLSQGCGAHKKIFDYYFEELAIKGRASQGNIVTKYPIRKITQTELGQSTLGAINVWLDEASGRLNTEERGKLLGDFDTGDNFFALYTDGTYEVITYNLTKRFDPKEIIYVGKFNAKQVVSAVYYDGTKKRTMVKRFKIETTKNNERFSYISEHKMSKLIFASIKPKPQIEYSMKVKGKKMQGALNLTEFIDVKGWKAIGNKLSDQKLTGVKEIVKTTTSKKKLKAGDSIELDVKKNGQKKMFD